ncbi:hypothetical protein B5X24_HaOG216856, partial [Helicoverpa armigera]
LSIVSAFEYTCILFKATSGEDPAGAVPIVNLRRWCTGSAGMCLSGFQYLDIDFFVEIEFFSRVDFHVGVYGKEPQAIDPGQAYIFLNEAAPYPEIEPYIVIRHKYVGAKNWNIWKFQTSVLLRGQGVYNIVDGTSVKPEDEAQRNRWEAQDAKAQTLLVTRMSEEVMLHIISCETSASMWQKLLSVYEQKSETSIHILQQRFFQFKYDENSDMSVFLSKIQEMQNHLKQLGEAVSDKFVITKILISLPEDYKHFVSSWESAPDDKQTYDNLVARLLIEEERIKEKGGSSQSSAAFVAKRNNRKTAKCFKCNKLGHYTKAINTAAYVINRTGKSSVDGKTPYELWSNKTFDINNLKVFGTPVYVHIPKEKRRKWDPKGEKGILVSYGETTKGYRVFFPHMNTVETKRDIIFVKENKEQKTESSMVPCVICVYNQVEEFNPNDAEKEDAEVQEQVVEEDDNTVNTLQSDSEGSLYEPTDSSEATSNLQRFGECDREEMKYEIFTDNIDLQNNGKLVYNLTILSGFEYSCIIFKASSGDDPANAVPIVKLRRWCTGSAGLCMGGFQYLEIHFFVEIKFFTSADLRVGI